MVGVPGKYKGCETCRRRRVKCSNERPFCQNCITSGRACEGYERERIFITGTPESKGRVASHPKKATPPKRSKAKASPSRGSEELPQVVPVQPLAPAWNEYMQLSNQGVDGPVLVTAMQTSLQSVVRHEVDEDENAGRFSMFCPPYAANELQPVYGNHAFGMNAQCFVRQAASDVEDDSTDGFCVFLFEHDASGGPWRLTAEEMMRLGPRNFKSFPNHHFFARVYRPLAISLALMSRQDTFLAAPEWTTTPWEEHPKSLLDKLFDIVVCIPSILAQTDRMVPHQSTLARRADAQELLHHCLVLESHFNQWLREACQGTQEYPYPYWVEDLKSPGGAIPFSNAYTFKDGFTGLLFLYYWTAQIPFHRCIENLHMIIFQPVIDAYPDMWPNLPLALQIDPAQYQDGRELAANICRGLDSALRGATQPDMLLAPMTMALRHYREINAASQDGVLEMMWLEAFKKRLTGKGQEMANVLQGQTWVEVGRF